MLVSVLAAAYGGGETNPMDGMKTSMTGMNGDGMMTHIMNGMRPEEMQTMSKRQMVDSAMNTMEGGMGMTAIKMKREAYDSYSYHPAAPQYSPMPAYQASYLSTKSYQAAPAQPSYSAYTDPAYPAPAYPAPAYPAPAYPAPAYPATEYPFPAYWMWKLLCVVILL